MLKNIKQILFTINCLVLAMSTNAQRTISGVILDASNQEALIGVSILDVNSGTGTATDIDGTFSLDIKDETTSLTFSYLGYKAVTMPVKGKSIFDINLEVDGVRMKDVVVTGLGIKRQKRELGYSTDSFDGNKIATSGAPNVVSALSGRSAGVNISSANGVDGGTSRVTIRGNNNITGNNQPLIIVDGVPIENPPGLTAIGRGTDWGSAINNINADDIADVSILKGPTASAKYGMRGANGVILITTKRGTKRNGIGVEYTMTHKVIQPYRYRSVQNKYGAGGPLNLLAPSFKQNGAGENVYPTDIHTSNGPLGRPTTEQFGFYSTGVSWGPELKGQDVRWWDGELRTWDAQPDNLKQYFRTGSTTTHNVNFSGGSDRSTTRASLTYQDHDAVVPNSKFSQYTFNLGSTLEMSEKLTADIALSYIKFDRKNSPSLGDDNNASFGKGILYSWPRSYKGLERELNINPDGSRNNYGGNYPFQFTPRHLWWNSQNQNTFLSRNKVIGSVGLSYNISDWLLATGRLGLDFNLNEFEQRFNPINSLGTEEGRYSNEIDRNSVNNNDVLITAYKDKIFDSAFDIKFSVGGTQWSRSQYGLSATATEWENPWLFSFSNFSGNDINQLPLAREIRYDKKINSVFSFVNLAYDNYLFLELSGRNDWSSSLPSANNSYFYPSASLSYIVTESLGSPVDWVNYIKLRGSVAKTATDTDPFLLDFVFNTGSFGGQQTATLPGTKPPTNLRPQQANSYEVGVTLGMFDDKISVDFTYYYINSFDQILDSPSPNSSGASSIRINNGILENYGFEMGITANVYQWSDGYVSTGFNFSRNRNFVKSLGDGAEFLEIGEIWGDFGPKIMVREGEEYGTIYGYDYVRHDNGQPILNEAGTHYQITDNIVPVGNASPDFTGGWTLNAKYKNLTLGTLVDAKIGGDIYAGSYVIGQQTGQSPSTLIERDGGGLPYIDPSGETRDVGVILPGVYADGSPNNKVVHYYYKYLPNAGGWGKILTTPGILDNSWVKMREIALTYNMPDNLVKKLRIFQDLNISLVGRDLFYLYSSLPDNVNPEGISGSGNAQGLEWASLPSMRSMSVRITSRF